MMSRIVLLLSLFSATLLAASCPRTQILLKNDFEPSDIVWDAARECLWVVSDDGELAKMSVDGQNIAYWTIPTNPDLEGVVLIPGREAFVYLQSEDSELFEFDVQSQTVIRTIMLKGSQLESVAWIHSTSVLYSGEQNTGKIHVYTIDFNTGMATQVDKFTLPAPNPGDLSTMHYEIKGGNENLVVAYDKSQIIASYTRTLGDVNNSAWKFHSQWKAVDLGTEGITLGTYRNQTYYFAAIDENQGIRAVMQYTQEQFNFCHQNDAALPITSPAAILLPITFLFLSLPCLLLSF